ncbi:MAG TPA: hypothetical protein VIM84_07925 [Gemmatimonadales bacterium]
MLLEAVAAALVGLAGLLLVLEPLLRRRRNLPPPPAEPIDPEETPRGMALLALKEIDFDRATGKLSDEDYQFLKSKYTALALEALRSGAEPGSPDAIEAAIARRVQVLRTPGASSELRCSACGPRPEPDAVYCSTCGLRLTPQSADSSPGPVPMRPEPAL